jgi:uncharacterized protein YeaO (DUF488 family)
MLQIKRIYEEPAQDDGYRILVYRLWPRGISKQRGAIDLWLKEIAPSPNLLIWFDHQAEKFDEFNLKYVRELSTNPAVATLEDIVAKHPRVTLLYAAKDPAINHAVVLKEFVESKTSRPTN